VEANIAHIDADDVWAAGYNGQGVIVGGQDTGYEWDHPALKNQYRGWNGATADHNYNWHDAIHSANPDCPADSPAPCDDHGHGTHTMGIMAGSGGIGVAPGARWIGCRNMDDGDGTPASYMECFQWFLAPTDLMGENPDPSRAPHVVNNSWGCPPGEGCIDPTILQAVVESVRAAGILTVHSAGNEGPACSTVIGPAGIYDAALTVGATDLADAIASFSSRGPVTVDGSGRLKPDLAAPGVSVRSAYLNGTYTHLSGTSMAAPHVAATAALLISARPELAGQVDYLETVLTRSARPLTSSQDCGSFAGERVPNAVFGYGRLDAWAAFMRSPLDRERFFPFVAR
jgi:subtilisin family serine protease